MWCVIGPEEDASARWAYEGLKARGIAPIQWVSAEELGRAVRWSHRVSDGGATVEITLEDGRRIDGSRLRGVLNRLAWPVIPHLPSITAADQSYVQQEITAFYMSWLTALPCPVLNRPTSQGLCGSWRHDSEWVRLAHLAGLPTPSYTQSSLTPVSGFTLLERTPGGFQANVIVVGGAVLGEAVPPEIGAGCVRLAQRAGVEILGVRLARISPQSWCFSGATVLPELRAGGNAALEALAALMGGRTA